MNNIDPRILKEDHKRPVIEVRQLCVRRKNDLILDNITFAVAQGSMVGVVGPNGAGKSTLLNTLVGVQPYVSGSVSIAYSKKLGELAYVPQRASVDWDFPITVYEVVMMGRYPFISFFASPSENDKALVENALQMVGMSTLRNRPIGQLSGGQQQRVFFARALVQQAAIYFLDEPFAGVDITTEMDLIAILKAEQKKGKTILLVHHDLHTAHDYFDTMLVLNRKLISYGSTHTMVNDSFLATAYGRSIDFIQG